MKKFKVVLFDFDGVLGRTMENNAMAWEYAFSKYGIRFNKDEYLLIEGLNTKKVVEHFAGVASAAVIDVEAIVSLKEKYYMENSNFSLYEGAEILLGELKKKGYRLGLVSAANYKRISKTVSEAIRERMDVIITGDRVRNCKPHPEPYLSAAGALSVSPGECVVVENAPLGIEAARAAGMYCIAIASTLEKRYLKNADRIVDTLSEIREML